MVTEIFCDSCGQELKKDTVNAKVCQIRSFSNTRTDQGHQLAISSMVDWAYHLCSHCNDNLKRLMNGGRLPTLMEIMRKEDMQGKGRPLSDFVEMAK